MVGPKYISCLRAIDRVYQDANIEVNFTEAIEWVGDVMDLLGCPVLYKTVVTNGETDEDGVIHNPIEISNYRGELPIGIVKILGALNYETKATLREITDTAYKSYGSSDNPNTISENSYTINNSYIFTGFEEGSIEMVYSTYVVDENGYPMVPDDTKITRAITSYITERLDYRNFRTGRIPAQVYQQSKQDRHFDMAAADMRVHMPSIDRMESWSKMNLNLLPRLRLHQNAFRHIPKRVSGTNGAYTGNSLAPITLDIDFQTVITQTIVYANNFIITKVNHENGVTVDIVFADGIGTWNLNVQVNAYREILITPSAIGIVTLHITFI